MIADNQPFDLRWVTRKSTGGEVLAEYIGGSYRALGTGDEFSILDVSAERNATLLCPCTECSHRRGTETRLRIAADEVRANPMVPPIVTDGVALSNAVRAKSVNAAAEQILDNLVNHLRYVASDAAAAMDSFRIPRTEGQYPS